MNYQMGALSPSKRSVHQSRSTTFEEGDPYVVIISFKQLFISVTTTVIVSITIGIYFQQYGFYQQPKQEVNTVVQHPIAIPEQVYAAADIAPSKSSDDYNRVPSIDSVPSSSLGKDDVNKSNFLPQYIAPRNISTMAYQVDFQLDTTTFTFQPNIHHINNTNHTFESKV